MGQLTKNMNNKYPLKSIFKYGSLAVLLLSIASCVDKFLPSDLDSLGNDSRFNQLEYRPVLGRNTLMQGMLHSLLRSRLLICVN